MLSLAVSSKMLRKARTPIDRPTVNPNAAAQPRGGVRRKPLPLGETMSSTRPAIDAQVVIQEKRQLRQAISVLLSSVSAAKP